MHVDSQGHGIFSARKAVEKMVHGFLENGDGKANWRPAGLYHWRRVCCSAMGGDDLKPLFCIF